MKILDLHPSDEGATHNTWILFGDPSLMLRTATPTAMNLTCQPEAIFLGQTELHLIADADYALATLSMEGNVLCTAPIVNGEGTLTFESLENVGTAKLVVTGFNKVTEVREVEVIPANGAYLVYESFSVNDSNGQADYGETARIDLTVKNIGNETANNVSVTLSTASPWIEVIDGTETIPSLAALESFTLINGFQITINEMISDGATADFDLVCTCGDQIWTSRFRMTLHAPAFVLSEFRPTTTAMPGVNDTLLFGIRNCGSSDAHDAKLLLFSSSSKLNFLPMYHVLGNIPAGQTVMVSVPFRPSHEVPMGSTYEVYYYMEAAPFIFDGIESLSIGPFKETFETGDFSAFDWETLGGAYWFIDNTTSNTGTFSARSGAVSHVNLTTLQVQIEVVEDGQISFYKKVSSEANKDKLTFYIDNTVMGEWSGVVDWSRETFAVTAGTHRFKWIYMKDSSGSYGDDACWIDDVQFPALSSVELMPALEVNASNDLNEVTLLWQSVSPDCEYAIYSNGQLLAIQPETTFTHLQNLGVFYYSVVAVNGEGQRSIPGVARVEITVLATDEWSAEVVLFPNPVSDRLQIELDQPFAYAIFNVMGQKVAEGEREGRGSVACDGLADGLYLIRLYFDNQVIVRKFVVK